MSDSKNTSNSKQETVTSHTDTSQKVEQLEKQLAEKDNQIKNIKEEAIKIIKDIKSKNSDDIAPGIRKTSTFGGGYKNAYANGSFQKHREKLALDARQSQVGKK